ncbi:hypothetical protein MSAN_00371000 [Mycena sanguinolenta]|uniref:Uncharacterized protein n=1 Tax=Mycena sanguinolenta TaxID=230812 RepID=A0A8H6Z976_9AGAR|nr:hypothetical protein MSAN_00371000 [Mycena sanguinolenta]
MYCVARSVKNRQKKDQDSNERTGLERKGKVNSESAHAPYGASSMGTAAAPIAGTGERAPFAFAVSVAIAFTPAVFVLAFVGVPTCGVSSLSRLTPAESGRMQRARICARQRGCTRRTCGDADALLRNDDGRE